MTFSSRMGAQQRKQPAKIDPARAFSAWKSASAKAMSIWELGRAGQCEALGRLDKIAREVGFLGFIMEDLYGYSPRPSLIDRVGDDELTYHVYTGKDDRHVYGSNAHVFRTQFLLLKSEEYPILNEIVERGARYVFRHEFEHLRNKAREAKARQEEFDERSQGRYQNFIEASTNYQSTCEYDGYLNDFGHGMSFSYITSMGLAKYRRIVENEGGEGEHAIRLYIQSRFPWLPESNSKYLIEQVFGVGNCVMHLIERIASGGERTEIENVAWSNGYLVRRR
ncbi:MAG: hypothetical protein QXP42_06105 [Candidatus Micrarchaeia archaeon]